MATNETMATRLGDLVRYETPMEYCRKRVLLAKSQTVVVGSCLDLANIGSTGATVVANSSEADVDAVALEKVTTGSGATGYVLCMFRGPAVIDYDKIALASGQDGTDRATMAAVLETKGISCRAEVSSATQGVMAG